MKEHTDTNNQNLTILRAQIDTIDEQIIKLIGERMQVVHNIGQLKAEVEVAVQDPRREAKIYVQLNELSKRYGVPLEVVTHVYDYLMQVSRDSQSVDN